MLPTNYNRVLGQIESIYISLPGDTVLIPIENLWMEKLSYALYSKIKYFGNIIIYYLAVWENPNIWGNMFACLIANKLLSNTMMGGKLVNLNK